MRIAGHMFSGALQLIFIIGLALLLLVAAYQRADVAVAVTDLYQWGVGGVLLALSGLIAYLYYLRQKALPVTGVLLSRGLVAFSLLGLGYLLLKHLFSGFQQVPIFDVATVLLIASLFALECAVLQQGRCQVSDPDQNRFKKMRPAIFLFLFGIDLSMAFIPLHMETLPQALVGISPDLLMGLPISVEFLCVGIAILCCGVWLDRSGWKAPFYCGLVLTGIGALYSWLAPDAVQFILSRGVLGFGYGLTLLASQGYVISHTDSGSKARGLAHLFAGLYSGSICGAATGAVLADRFGYGPVFLLGAVVIFSVVLYGWWVLREPAAVASKDASPAKAQSVSNGQQKAGVLSFLCNRQVLAATLFSSMPASIAVVGFLNYFSPVYLDRAGVNDASIGQVLMLFGVILALFGPAIGRFADQCQSKRIPIILGCFLGGLAFLVFVSMQGVMAVTLAILLLGISNCLVLSAQSAYVLHQPVTQSYGEGKAMGIFRSSSRIGQMLGPVIFAVIITTADIEFAVVLFGLAYLVTAILFTLLTLPGRRQKEVITEVVTNE